MPFPERMLDNPSVYKRMELLSAGYKMIHANNYLFGTGNAKSSMLWFRMHEDDRKHAMILAGNRALLQLAKMGVNTKV